MTEWGPYAFAMPVAGQANDGALLTTVHHVAHPADAIRIIEDRAIRAGLVYDESRLNTSRISVAWVSANTWAWGSIYGNVQFTFPWSAVIQDKNIYWVEAMPSYSPPAYRFLITRRKPLGEALVPYDPQVDDGPLRLVGEQWYWNGKYTSEFMIDEELPLAACQGIDTIEHHKTYCRLKRGTCTSRKDRREQTGARLIGHLLGNADRELNPLLINSKGTGLSTMADFALMEIFQVPKDFSGSVSGLDDAVLLVRSALSYLGRGQRVDARNLLKLLQHETIFKLAVEAIIRDHFGWSTYKYS